MRQLLQNRVLPQSLTFVRELREVIAGPDLGSIRTALNRGRLISRQLIGDLTPSIVFAGSMITFEG